MVYFLFAELSDRNGSLNLRFRLLYLICFCQLSGCVYYGDLHSSAKQLSYTHLTSSHRYPIPQRPTQANWWQGFNDPQLNQLIGIALSDSPTMAMAESRVREADRLTDESAASLWPSADLSGSIQRQRFSQYGLAPPPFNGKTFNIGEVGLNFNYEFDFWGKNRHEIEARINTECALAADLAEARLVI